MRWTLAVVGVAAGSFAMVMAAIAAFGWCDHLGESEVGLVLGNTVDADGRPSTWLQARLDAALRLRRLGYFEKVIVSGGVDSRGHDEAAVMHDYLVAHGVPTEAVIVDSAGVNTYESARHTVAIMRQHGWRGVCVVTQYFHVPRARLALGHFGAHDVSSGSARFLQWSDFYSTAREAVAYAWYAWRHYDHIPGNARQPEETPGASTNSTPA